MLWNIENEIKQNMGDAKWASAYEKEYQTQYKRLKGQSVMGLGEFHECNVKQAAV